MLFKFYDVLAQVLIAQEQYADAHLLLEKILRAAFETGAVNHEIRTRGRLALLLQAEGDEASALEIFAPALDLAASGQYVRTILDLGENIARLIYTAVENGVQVEYCSRLMENLQQPKLTRASEHQDLIEPLSSREIEVLDLIALGYTNQEIAEALVLSLYTVKSHARNIYGKLGVKNRTEAVARARLYGLLSED
jgi:LuxR family maltose regulon positive regulatory protein